MAHERRSSPLQLIETCEVGLFAIMIWLFPEQTKNCRQTSYEVSGQLPFLPALHGSICSGAFGLSLRLFMQRIHYSNVFSA